MMQHPIPVALVGFGHEANGQYELIREYLDEPNVVYKDFRGLDDLQSDQRCRFREDGTNDRNIIAIYVQEGSAETVIDVIDSIIEHVAYSGDGCILFGGCKGGFHRTIVALAH